MGLKARAIAIPAGRRLTHMERMHLFMEVAATYAEIRWWLARYDFRSAVVLARGDSTAAKDQRAEGDAATRAGLRLGEIVERSLRPIPFDSRCLIRALVLTRMLVRRGIDSTLVLGVRRDPTFLAHAWLEREGVALLPTDNEFHRLAEF